MKHKNLLSYIKMGKEILTFGDIEIEKTKCYHNRTPIFFLKKYADIEKVLVSNKVSFVEKNFKYCIGYLYKDNKVKSLQVILPKTSAYVKIYDRQKKWIYFLIEDDDLLRNIILCGIKSVLIQKRV